MKRRLSIYGNKGLLSTKKQDLVAPKILPYEEPALRKVAAKVESVVKYKSHVTLIDASGIEEPEEWPLTPLDRAIGAIGSIPLKWGAPRILVLPKHLEQKVRQGYEPHAEWRLWRWRFDPKTDLAIFV